MRAPKPPPTRPSNSWAGTPELNASRSRLARTTVLADLFHHCVHVQEVPDLGELSALNAVKSELRNRHPTTGRLDSLESTQVSTGDREVHHDVVVVDNDVPHLPVSVRERGDKRRELRRYGSRLHGGVIDFDRWGIERRHRIEIVVVAIFETGQIQGLVIVTVRHEGARRLKLLDLSSSHPSMGQWLPAEWVSPVGRPAVK
jgi:hypothetical protein